MSQRYSGKKIYCLLAICAISLQTNLDKAVQLASVRLNNLNSRWTACRMNDDTIGIMCVWQEWVRYNIGVAGGLNRYGSEETVAQKEIMQPWINRLFPA